MYRNMRFVQWDYGARSVAPVIVDEWTSTIISDVVLLIVIVMMS